MVLQKTRDFPLETKKSEVSSFDLFENKLQLFSSILKRRVTGGEVKNILDRLFLRLGRREEREKRSKEERNYKKGALLNPSRVRIALIRVNDMLEERESNSPIQIFSFACEQLKSQSYQARRGGV